MSFPHASARGATRDSLLALHALGFDVTVRHAPGCVQCAVTRAGQRWVTSSVSGDGPRALHRCVVQLCVELSADTNLLEVTSPCITH